MRIALDARSIGIYPGTGRYALYLIRALSQIDKKNEYIILLDYRSNIDLGIGENFKIIKVKYPLLSFATWIKLPKIIESFAPDIFHSLFQVSPPVSSIKTIATVHDMMDLNYPFAFSHHPYPLQIALRMYFFISILWTVKRCLRIIAVSNSTKNDLIARFPSTANKIAVIYEAADTKFFNQINQKELEIIKNRYHLPDLFVLYIGSTKRYKNVEGLVEAFSRVVSNYNKSVYLVLGGMKNVARDKIDNLISDKGIRDKVLFLGEINEEDLPAVYQLATIFVLLSFQEGFGLPVLEAMASGLPVITSNRGSLPEVVGNAGIIFSPEDYEGVSLAIIQLLENSEKRNEMGRQARERASQFSWEQTARQTLELYYEVMEEKIK